MASKRSNWSGGLKSPKHPRKKRGFSALFKPGRLPKRSM